MNLAPVILFVYNRPWHTRQVLEALKLNELSKQSILYIFSDGPKKNLSSKEQDKIEEVRNLIREEKWCGEVHIIERKQNYGLAKSIKIGVSEIIGKYEKVIVLEDDIVVSKGFLTFMNTALKFYQNHEKVMHISGFMYPHNQKLPETFFFNVPLCWGWATWKRSWDHFKDDSLFLWKEIQNKNLVESIDKFGEDFLSSQLAHNLTGNLNTWFIKWHISVFLKGGYTLYPKESLVENIGFDNTGVHNGYSENFKNHNLAEKISIKEIEFVENKSAEIAVRNFYQQLNKSSSQNNSEPISFKSHFLSKIRSKFYQFFPELRVKPENPIKQYKTYLGKYAKIYPKARLNNVIIGNYSYIAENSIINNTVIGKFCSIGPNLISGWGIHPTSAVSTHPMFYSTRKQNGYTLSQSNKIEEVLPVKIGNDVFIGMNVTILDGVNIGDGAIIGAGAVVSEDIPPYAIAVGNPIKILKFRFSNDKIAELEKLKWWDFEEGQLKIIEENFFDIDLFLKKAKKYD